MSCKDCKYGLWKTPKARKGACLKSLKYKFKDGRLIVLQILKKTSSQEEQLCPLVKEMKIENGKLEVLTVDGIKYIDESEIELVTDEEKRELLENIVENYI